MKPEVSLHYPQKPATFSYSEPEKSSRCPPSHFLRIHFNIILPSMPASPGGLHSSGFPTKTLYAPLLSPIRATKPAHLILLDLITRIIFGEEYRSLSSPLCSLLHSSITSPVLGPNILCTLFLYTIKLHSCINVSDKVSHPYKTTGKIIFLCILIFIFLDGKRKARDSVRNYEKHCLTSACP